jgi:hypothetical protein
MSNDFGVEEGETHDDYNIAYVHDDVGLWSAVGRTHFGDSAEPRFYGA